MSHQDALTSSSLQLVQWRSWTTSDDCWTLMTGDEKHDPAAYSTLDVLQVLYERVLDVSPEHGRRPAPRPVPALEGTRPGGVLRRPLRPRLLPRVLAGRLGDRSTPLSAHHPDRNLVPGVEISSGSLGHGLPARGRDGARAARPGHRLARRRAGRRRGARRGLQPRGARARAGARPRRPDRRRGRQPQHVVRRAGPDRRAVRHRGLGGRDRRRSRPRRAREGAAPSDRSASRTSSSPPSSTTRRQPHDRHPELPSLLRDPRAQFGRTVTDLLDEDLSTALVWAEISARYFDERRTPAPRPRRQRRHPRAAARQRRRRASR